MVTRALVGASLSLVLGLALVTHQRVLDWQSDRTLWTAAVSVTPDRPRVLINASRALMLDPQPGDLAQALTWNAQARSLLQRPERSHRRDEWARAADVNYALLLVAARRPDVARSVLVAVLAQSPGFDPAARLLAVLP